jgi:outer membrane receptor protein involved in Fe transport
MQKLGDVKATGPAVRFLGARLTDIEKHSAFTLFATSLLVLVGFAHSPVAFAQAAPAATDIPLEEIVVTGSRIARPEYDNPAPVYTYDSRAIEESGSVVLGDTLSRLPQLGASATSGINANNPQTVGTVNLDLRRLGVNRTLVLIDGQRQVGADDGTGAVDINTIPSNLIDRVEILTGGASAVYGADAVTGVVNFILKHDYQGASINVQYGDASEGGPNATNVNAIAGTSFGDNRGNITVGVDFSSNTAIEADDRSFRRASGFFVSNPANPNALPGSPSYVFRSPVFEPYYSSNGLVHDFENANCNGANCSKTNVFQLARGGNIEPFNDGILTDYGYNALSGSGELAGPLYGNAFLPQVQRIVFDVGSHYAWSDFLTTYGDIKFARSASSAEEAYNFSSFPVEADNAFLSPQGRALLASLGADSFTDNRTNEDIGRPLVEDVRETYRIVAGMRGNLNPSLKFDTSFEFSSVNNSSTTSNDLFGNRLFAASDAIVGPNGQIECRVTAQQAAGQVPKLPDGTPAPDYAVQGCVPFNVFGNNAASAAAKQWVTASYTNVDREDQLVANATVSGDTKNLFVLPAGAISFAGGVEYRRETSSATPDALVALGLFSDATATALSGSYNVKEGFAEFSAPIAKQLPFAEDLEVTGAYRYSDYSTIGSTNTWNAGLVWAPIKDIRVRGSISEAIRAPNIGELYGAQGVTSQFANDPCSAMYINSGTTTRKANCQALGISGTGLAGPFNNFGVVSGGNPTLFPERSRSYTAGFVLQPSLMPHFDVSVDYWNYDISDAISSAGLQEILDNCVDAPSLDPNTCSLIKRNPTTHQITEVSATEGNFAALKADGVDIKSDYRYPIPGGELRLDFASTYTAGYKVYPFQAFPNVAYNYAGFLRAPGVPRVNGQLALSANFHSVDFTYRVRGSSGSYYDSPASFATNADVYSPGKSPFYKVQDIYLQYRVSDILRVYGGINNIAQQYPPFGLTGASGTSGIFDNIGRYFYAGIRISL